MKITSKIVSLILLISFFVGLCVLLYPALSQYWNSKVQSQVVASYEKMLAESGDKDFTPYFEQAEDYNQRLSETSNPMVNYGSVSGYRDALNVMGNGMIGSITIDKLGVELPIYHGTGIEVLSSAVGHLEGTSLPIGGYGRHAVLSAHRGLPNARLFTDLDKMEIGDVFVIKILNERFTYQVDQIKVVKPSQSEDLQTVRGEDYCTLLTCTPYGINTHRLLVRGKRIENSAEKVNIYVNSEAYLVDRTIVSPIVALPILFALTLYVFFKPAKKKPSALANVEKNNVGKTAEEDKPPKEQ